MNARIMDVRLHATLKGHQNQVFALAKGDNNMLFTAGNDKGVVEWDLTAMKFRRILCAVSHPVYALLHIPETNLLAIGLRSGEVMIVDYVEQALRIKIKLDQGAVFALKVLQSKKELLAIGEEGVAYVFDTLDFKPLYRFRVSDKTVRTIAISPDESDVYFGDKEGVVYHYSSSDYQLLNQSMVHTMPVTSLLCWETVLFSGGRDARMYKLNGRDLGIVHEVTPHMFTVYGIASHSDHSTIATVSRDKTFKFWNPESLTLLKNISIDRGYDSHYLSINTVLWERDYLYTAGDDKMIKIWQVEVG